jgi:hypothetical protein
MDELPARGDEQRVFRLKATLFADFLIANADLIQQVVAGFRRNEDVGMELLIEVEQRAQRRI